MCNPCPYDGDCEQCKKDMYQKFGEDVAVKCVLCGDEYKINRDKANYAHKFGTNAGLNICSECKDALAFAKEMKRICKRKETVTADLTVEEVKKFLETTLNGDWRMPFSALTPEPCRNCPTHPNNGGDGICHCTLGTQVSC